MDLTVAAVTKNRAGRRLDNMVTTLSSQVNSILIIDENTDKIAQEEVQKSQQYQNFTLIQSPRQIFNMPYAFNLALQECRTPYIMFTGIDMMFSSNFVRFLTEKLDEGSFVMGMMGGLEPDYAIPYNPIEEWSKLKKICEDGWGIHRKYSTGTQIASTDWFRKIGGFDERFVKLGGIDTDMMNKATQNGLAIKWIEWEEAQIIHQWHSRSSMKGKSSHLCYDT